MSQRPGVGLIGCGRIARMFHLPILRDLPSARLVAVADIDETARAAAVAEAPGVVGVPDTDSLLNVPGIDAVVVCLPSHLHADATVAALGASRHVYVEKPLAVDPADGRRIHAAWSVSGTVGAVGFNLRFHPLYRRARELLASGRLGTLVAARTVFSSAPRELPEWKRHRRTGGGALLDLASHHLDLLPYLLDTDVESVSATVRSRLRDHDTAALTLHLSSGPVAQVLATASAAQADRLEVLGSEATLHADRMTGRAPRLIPSREPATRPERLTAAARIAADGLRTTIGRLRPRPEPSFAAALSAFAEAVRTGTWSGATIADGCRILEIGAAAERSALTGEPVVVSTAAGTPGDAR